MHLDRNFLASNNATLACRRFRACVTAKVIAVDIANRTVANWKTRAGGVVNSQLALMRPQYGGMTYHVLAIHPELLEHGVCSCLLSHYGD